MIIPGKKSISFETTIYVQVITIFFIDSDALLILNTKLEILYGTAFLGYLKTIVIL